MLDARKARRARGGDQVINTSNTFTTELEPDDPLFQEIVQAQGPYPIGAAEVVGTPTQYEEADLAKAGLLALRETGGMVPGLDYALDAAELENIRRTGKDFYGDETTPESYATMLGAGMLLPGVLRRAGRGIGKAAKKFFKFGKKADSKYGPGGFAEGLDDLEFNRTLDELPKKNKASGENVPPIKRDLDPRNVFESNEGVSQYPTYQLGNYPSATPAGQKTQEGVDYARRFYADPDVQDMLRKQYQDMGVEIHPEAKVVAQQLAEIDKIKSGVNARIDTRELDSLREGIAKSQNKAYDKGLTIDQWRQSDEGSQILDEFTAATSEHKAKFEELYLKELEADGISPSFAEAISGHSWSSPHSYEFENLPPGTDLEFTFLRGSQSPEIMSSRSAQIDMQLGPVKAKSAGVYRGDIDRTFINPTVPTGKKSIALHETEHFASAIMNNLNSETSKALQKEMGTLVKPEYSDYASGVKAYWKEGSGLAGGKNYLADPKEIMARAMQVRLGMSETLLNNPDLTKLQRKQILMGDFSSLDENQTKKLLAGSLWKGGVEPSFYSILNGKGVTKATMDSDRVDALSKMLKISFVGAGAAGAYGAMDNQGGQPSNSMYAGGVITMRKKKKGMSTIRK